MTTNYTRIDTAEVAKIIRGELREHFPAYKFSVRSERYSGGSSIRVNWMDGPTTKQVEEKIGQYHGASFDGMQDLKEYHSSRYNGEVVHFGNDFLFCNRDYSDAALQEAVKWYQSTYGDGDGIEFIPTRQSGKYTLQAYIKTDNYEIERRVYQHLQETEH